jgi:hypothetical protein
VPAAAVTVGVVVALVPFAVGLPGGTLAALWVISMAARSIAPVHQHCHAHYRVFGSSVLDVAYDAILMLAAGNTTAVWELQHVRGHHRRYLGEGDPAGNHRFGGGRMRFTVLGDAMSAIDAWRIARGDVPARAKLAAELAFQVAIAALLIARDLGLALAFVIAPWLLLRWAVFWFSYAQHDDVPRRDVYSGSVTHFGWTNRLYLNVGHHTAHHEKPTLHWTKLPARTAQILDRIPTSCLR